MARHSFHGLGPRRKISICSESAVKATHAYNVQRHTLNATNDTRENSTQGNVTKLMQAPGRPQALWIVKPKPFLSRLGLDA
jgi:hypothetical protein